MAVHNLATTLQAVRLACAKEVSAIDDMLIRLAGEALPEGRILKDVVVQIPPLAYAGGSYAYLFLLAEAFPHVSQEVLLQGALASIYYILASKMDDWVIDGEIAGRYFCWALLRRQLLFEKARTILRSLFSPSSHFWQLHDQYHRESVQANFLERIRHTGIVAPYPKQEMEQIASGKSSFAKLIPVALAILAGDELKAPPLVRSIEKVAIGNQLYDDVKDWKEDYERKYFSYLLTRVVYAYNLQEQVIANPPLETKTIGQFLYYGGTIEAVLDEAIHYYSKAIKAVDGLACSGWVEAIWEFQRRIEHLKDDLGEIRTRVVQEHTVANRR